MKKIGFVTPWYGRNITGGAEAELRGLTDHLKNEGVELEILTTCVQSFSSDWNINFYKPGEYEEEGIVVKRFKIRKRDVKSFDRINAKFIQHSPVSDAEADLFLKEMINSDDLYEYMRENQNEYDLFVFIPYMFGTTYYGAQVCPKKSVLIPCFHDEPYIYIKSFKDVFSKIAGIVYNALPEKELANRVFNLKNVKQGVFGLGMDTDIHADPRRFRKKYGLDDESFILYAGRKDCGKNVDTLIKYFCEYKRRNDVRLKLILIGGGEIEIPDMCKNDILDLGFVDKQDKYDAYAAAGMLCQPSKNESFSIVIMESWLCKRPVLVHEMCEVTKSFVIQTNGGLYFDSYFEFEGAVNYILSHPDVALQMGENGCAFVNDNFSWDKIMEKYIGFFNELI
ncbi:glycosyltransferase family 4 protein [Anaerostipes sp.]|uniref:glycosyltransferase family 4 protein n=1 Tax=Anaerostipes sp. TaxID=1872530 RepID=UPI00258560E3|nr:glycosyltransferase family 4 protein [Anaerostipes sp.]MCI5623678.1 glycosyltransferase family 4 protein [Anaerostipes sp.]